MGIDTIAEIIMQVGVLGAIAAVFIWQNIQQTKQISQQTETINKVLTEMNLNSQQQAMLLVGIKTTSNNMVAALNRVTDSLTGANQSLERHDVRAENMNNEIREMTTLISARPCLYKGKENEQ